MTGTGIARNAVLSLTTAVFPALVGILTMPYVIRGLGTDAFGVLSLAWVVLGIFAILDFGVSRATTRRVAESRSRGEEHRIGAVIWTALATNVGIGVFSAVVMIAGSETFVERVLKVPPALHEEATLVFWLLGAAIPASLAAGVLRSALEGAHRFDLTALIQIPANALNFIWPALIVAAGGDLVPVVLTICATRFALVPLFFAGCRREFPDLGAPCLDRAEGVFLLRDGGWLTVSSVIGPILVNLDRLLVASLLGVRSVAFYAAPYEMVSRLTMIPASLMSALFPALSGFATGNGDRLAEAYGRALRHLLLVMVPICGLLAAFAPEILTAWLGPQFAAEGSAAVRVLAVGLLALSLSSLPFTALQAIGRADVAAKIHAAELVPYALIAWQLVSRFGLVGAAAAWSARAVVDGVLFHIAARRVGAFARLQRRDMHHALVPVTFAAGVVLLAAMRHVARPSWLVELFVALGVAALYALVAWRYILDASERVAASQLVRRRARSHVHQGR